MKAMTLYYNVHLFGLSDMQKRKIEKHWRSHKKALKELFLFILYKSIKCLLFQSNVVSLMMSFSKDL